jgi:hypothetical protein
MCSSAEGAFRRDNNTRNIPTAHVTIIILNGSITFALMLQELYPRALTWYPLLAVVGPRYQVALRSCPVLTSRCMVHRQSGEWCVTGSNSIILGIYLCSWLL